MLVIISVSRSKSVYLGLIITITIMIVSVTWYAYSPMNLDRTDQKNTEELELEQIMQEIKQSLQFQKENPDVDMYCLEKTRQSFKEIGIEDLYEQGYQASCIEQKKPNDELNLETFCTLETMEFYQSLGMTDIYHEIAIKNC